MNGKIALTMLASADPGILALMPVNQITSGVAPQGTPLPILSFTKVSSVDYTLIAPGPKRFVTQRIRATVLGKTSRQVDAIMKAVKHALADRLYPEVAGIEGLTIHCDGEDSDGMEPMASIHFDTMDFKVKYTENT